MKAPEIAAIVFALVPQTAPQPVKLPCDWAVGTRYHLEITKTREHWQDDKSADKSASVLPIDVEVTGKNSDGYVFRWTLGRGAIVAGPTNPMGERVSELNEGLRVEFTTDAQGSFKALIAPEKLEAEMAKRIETLGKELPKQGMSSEEVSSFTRILATSFRGDGYRASLSRDPQLFYMPAGSALVLGEKRAWDTQLQNPLGGDSLPANAYLELRAIKPEINAATVEWRQSIDPAKAIPIIEKSARAAAKQRGESLPEGLTFSMDAVEEAATYVYDVKSGWPKSVVWTRSTFMTGIHSLETIRFDVTFPITK